MYAAVEFDGNANFYYVCNMRIECNYTFLLHTV